MPSLPGPNRLSTVTNEVVADASNASMTWRTVSSAPNGTTNWYCTKPARPVDPVPVEHPVERVEERRDGLEWPCRRGALRNQTSLNART